ncbi:hypothetical protein QZH41_017077 [Actinostola sp. cb2023]|nr:hypothetical protein QZH41_017077 [Actinostola sp. cb2023]
MERGMCRIVYPGERGKPITNVVFYLQRSPPTQISNLATDLSDGKALLNLLEVLTDKKLKKEKGNLRVHKINNVERALTVLDECNVQEVMHQEGNQEASKSFAVEKVLLEWCKERLKGYDIKISDFSGSWRDGKAFNAILHSYRPEAFDYTSLSHVDERERLDHAFLKGEKEFGIPRILDSSDVYVERPDKKLIILCLSHWYDYLEGPKAKDKQTVDEQEVVIAIDDNTVESSLPDTWDDVDAGPSRSPEECAEAQREITRKLDDLEATADDAESRKPDTKQRNLLDLETCKTHLDKHNKYLRTLDSLGQIKTEVFGEVDQAINEGYCDQNETEHYNGRMKYIDERIKGLREDAQSNKEGVSLAYSVFLKQNLEKMEDFVVKSENHIKKTTEVGSDYETIKQQQEEHKQFQEDLSDHVFINMVLEVDVSDPAMGNETRGQVKSISQRWKRVWDWSEDRKKKLMRSLVDWQKFRDEELILLNWLAGKEKTLKEINKTDLMDEEEVKKTKMRLDQIQKELDEQETRLDNLHECGEKLIKEADDDKEAVEEIEKQLKDFDGCWNDIATQVIEGKEKLHNASNKIKEMQTDIKEVNEWMEEANKLMENHDSEQDQEEQNKIKDKIELKCEERPQTQVRVQRTNRLAKDVMSLLDSESSEKLEKDVEQFNEKWKDTSAALESFSDKGYSDKSECCLMRIIKRKFKSTNN